ncbi:MAG: hypothetical protein A3J70_10490 [Elusimicrobia bacterium RIFCSPHIGHO2_02_FULL_61_10]|nr:MAG: hypothetical protein A3J70_10490 [Elusimicrobia bacterium RIFCSPHIGHO2_02_FULL_61_10]
MGKDKKCYSCGMVVDGDAAVCPSCDSKLGRRLPSGRAQKPGFPFVKMLLVIAGLGAAVKLSGYSDKLNAAPENKAALPVEVTRESFTPRDAAIQKIKDKGSQSLSSVGILDVGYKDDTLLVYVDQRFTGLDKTQQEQLLIIVAGEWQEAIGKETSPIRVLETGTNKVISELVL